MVKLICALEENLNTRTMPLSNVPIPCKIPKIYSRILKQIIQGLPFLFKWEYWLLAWTSPSSHVIGIRTESNEDSYFGSLWGKFKGLLWFWNCKNCICQYQLNRWYWPWLESQQCSAAPLGFLPWWRKKSPHINKIHSIPDCIAFLSKTNPQYNVFIIPIVISLFNMRALKFC